MADTDLSTVIMAVPCPQCHEHTTKPLSELIVSNSVICRRCSFPIDITRPYWQEAFRKAAESARKIEPKAD